MKSIELIKQERERQVENERWTAEHDDGHRHGEIAIAAAELAVYGTDARVVDPTHDDASHDDDCWGLVEKHKDDRIRQLVIAGALIAAEIDREMRLRKLSAACSECNWSNTNLLNLGEPGSPRMVCHGCAKRAIEQRDCVVRTLVNLTTVLHKIGQRHGEPKKEGLNNG